MTRVLVTRPAEQADELRRRLADRGIATTSVPTVAIEPDAAASDLRDALGALGPGEGRPAAAWLVMTSANGARAVVECTTRNGIRLPEELRIAAVGPATADVLRDAGLTVHHVPDEFLTVAIAEGLGDVRGRRIVLARADAATPDLSLALRRRGARVEEVVAYRTVEGPPASRVPLRRALHTELSGVTFTSGSTVRGLIALVGSIERRRASLLPAFCIGPVTAEAARMAGFDPAVIASEHTAAGLADAIGRYFDRRNRT